MVRAVPVNAERQPFTVRAQRVADDPLVEGHPRGVLVMRMGIGARVPSFQAQIESPLRSQPVMFEPRHPDGVLPVATGRLAEAPAIIGRGEVGVQRAAKGRRGEPEVEPRHLVRLLE